MSKDEIYQVAEQVAQILQSGPVERKGDGCSMSPAKPAIDEKHVNNVVNEAQDVIMRNLHSDEEQFLAVGKLRERMARYWDEQATTSNEVSSVNSNRAQTLGKFIEMTMPR
ncbi:hypothetical protein GCM10028818_41130 [Spirosoma horti]